MTGYLIDALSSSVWKEKPVQAIQATDLGAFPSPLCLHGMLFLLPGMIVIGSNQHFVRNQVPQIGIMAYGRREDRIIPSKLCIVARMSTRSAASRKISERKVTTGIFARDF